MLLGGELRQTGTREFDFIGRVMVYHSFQSLSALLTRLEHSETLTRFFPGLFVREFEGKRIPEMLESPEAMALRMRLV